MQEARDRKTGQEVYIFFSYPELKTACATGMGGLYISLYDGTCMWKAGLPQGWHMQ
jgi:hypothetical protein